MIVTVTLNPAVDKAVEVPGFRVGAHAKGTVKTLLPAGKGNNVARGLARLGGQAVASGFVGASEEGLFADSLAQDGVETRFCTVAGRTRTNTTILDPKAHTTTHLREEGFNVTADERHQLRGLLVGWIAEHGDATAVFAGSLPREFTAEHLAELLKACASAGARLVVDTSGDALRAAVGTGAVDVVKPNLQELGQLLGAEVDRGDAPEAARMLLGSVRTVLLTLGEEGAYLVRGDPPVGRRCALADGELQNTVGCGDAFLAGWLRGEQVCEEPEEALCWAVAAGAASARSPTTVGYALKDVRELLPRCEPLG